MLLCSSVFLATFLALRLFLPAFRLTTKANVAGYFLCSSSAYMPAYVCVFVLLLGDRCTTQRDSVTHNKFEDISTKSVRFHFTYFCSLFFCSFNKSFIISRLFFLRLVDWFAFCENLFSLAAVGAAFFPVRCFFLSFFSVGFHFILAAKRLFAISSYTSALFTLFIVIFQFCF